MARPTKLYIDAAALLHNLNRIRQLAPGKKVIAMVKANAYGCGIKTVLPVLEGRVEAFGVACLEEALAIRKLGSKTVCVVFQGIFNAAELPDFVDNDFACVLHTHEQIDWILNTAVPGPLKVWIKVDTGMHRLGFKPREIPAVLARLRAAPQVDKNLVIMTHLACADDSKDPMTLTQLDIFNQIDCPAFTEKSIANSGGILNFPQTHADIVRPGIMLYGVSPSPEFCGMDLGLLPVMRFMTTLIAIHHYPHPVAVGYGATWKSDASSIIGIISAGYGDGYPRHVNREAYVWINGYQAPIAGRISMDMMAIDLTHCPKVHQGDPVELWGTRVPVEKVAGWADTIAYELLCQTSNRVRGN